MSSSNQTPVDRVTISSRSHSAQPATPLSAAAALHGQTGPSDVHHPGETVFAEDEETESFYVILDITGDDFAEYGKYRDGRKFRPRVGETFGDDDEDEVEDGDDDEEGRQTEAEEDDAEEEEDDDDEVAGSEDDADGSDEGSDSSDGDDEASTGTSARELQMQILDLDSYNPLVNYEGKIYSCKWAVSNGTEMIFEAPPDESNNNTQPQNDGTRGSLSQQETETTDTLSRKIRKDPEAKLIGTTIHRVEGWPAKVRPRGRDKQEVSTKARIFAERLDAVLEHRIAEMRKRGEDVSGITMKKFSEGQQQPWLGAKES